MYLQSCIFTYIENVYVERNTEVEKRNENVDDTKVTREKRFAWRTFVRYSK